MASMTFKARVRKDGLLTLPKQVRERLHLQPGEEVEVSIRADEGMDEQTVRVIDEESVRNPLYGIIGLGKAGKVDGAENHDRYLYERDCDAP